MSIARYDVHHDSAGWVIVHDGEVSPPYEMPEAAFEAAIAAASLSLRDRYDVVISLTHDKAAKWSRETSGNTSDLNLHG